MARMNRETTEQTGREYHIFLSGAQVQELNRLIDRMTEHLKGTHARRMTGTQFLSALIGQTLRQTAPLDK